MWMAGLRPRPMTVRVFAARTPKGWTVMPRRLCPDRARGRSDGACHAARAGRWRTSDRRGKTPTDPRPPRRPRPVPSCGGCPGFLPSRAADNLFWLGRYVERAEGAHTPAARLPWPAGGSGRGRHSPCSTTSRPFFGPDANPRHADPAGPARGPDPGAGLRPAGARPVSSPDGWLALDDLSRATEALKGELRPGDDAVRGLGDLLRRLAGGSTGLRAREHVPFRRLAVPDHRPGAGTGRCRGGAAPGLRRSGRSGRRLRRCCRGGGQCHDPSPPLFSVEANRSTVIDPPGAGRQEPPVSGLSDRPDPWRGHTSPGGGGRTRQVGCRGSRRSFCGCIPNLRVMATFEEVTTRRLADLRDRVRSLSDRLTAQYLG